MCTCTVRDGLQTGPGLWLSPALSDHEALLEAHEGAAGASRLAEALVRHGDDMPLCVLGAFKGGALSGIGMAMLTEQIVYVGGFQDWQPSGHGVRFLADGSVYRGQWEDGAPHGVGELTHASAQSAQAAADARIATAEAAIRKLAEAEAALAVAEAMTEARSKATS